MTPITEIGEIVISTPDQEYFLRPSFIAMSRIGNPAEIVALYATLSGAEVNLILSHTSKWRGGMPAWMIEQLDRSGAIKRMAVAAEKVIAACSQEDTDQLTGELKAWREYAVVKRNGLMSRSEKLIIARELIEHGVMGKAPVRVLQRNESKHQFTKEFRAVDYITSARSHFGMSREEAEQLTMTEFQLMLKAKYPEEKGLTREEYDAVIDADDKRTEELLSGKRRLVRSKRDPSRV